VRNSAFQRSRRETQTVSLAVDEKRNIALCFRLRFRIAVSIQKFIRTERRFRRPDTKNDRRVPKVGQAETKHIPDSLQRRRNYEPTSWSRPDDGYTYLLRPKPKPTIDRRDVCSNPKPSPKSGSKTAPPTVAENPGAYLLHPPHAITEAKLAGLASTFPVRGHGADH